ncbi:MAG: dihydrofolate synthase / folylpolyglutamate synthase [Bacillota bacterium]|jgi:dihydrofolate synthase/folylpolyglutamate synthase|nr:dihydrofolate synthase / folylpolyglutamate synthase [Bacillota bacterium]MDK2882822.1 dihydrofolate synthase / folylpolyglutamate synthase [Bacillota bacterium]MDK2960519.1 dihydrofolate synthase / folylpolyglutamate synthase [Bacillota bacterium]
MMNWQEAAAWLESLGRFGSRPGLERIEKLLGKLGHPEQGLKVIHVAGTNGKGSVCAFVSSVLAAAGYRTGLYTSPHLVEYRERFQINGTLISLEELAALLTDVRRASLEAAGAGGEEATEFEVLTAAAFLYFATQKVDYLVLEVGLGGRLDATNVVRPEVAVITHISYDHTAVLGCRLAEIAREKAGIIKPGCPVVMAPQEEEAAEVIAAVAAERRAPLHRVQAECTVIPRRQSLSGQSFDLCISGRSYRDLSISLLGDHQVDNAATAALALTVLSSKGAAVSEDALRQGLAAARWPARFEVVLRSPVVVIDGAHNPDGAEALARAVQAYLPKRRLILVLGVLGDKDVPAVLRALGPLAQVAVVTRPASPRAAEPEHVASGLRAYVPEVYVEPEIERAVQRALSLAGPEDVVLVAGSLYMAGVARRYLLIESGTDEERKTGT